MNEYLGKELKAAGWALQPDDQVSRGGCRVTSATGELDATWESRWQAVRQQVRGRHSASEQAAAAQGLLEAAQSADEPATDEAQAAEAQEAEAQATAAQGGETDAAGRANQAPASTEQAVEPQTTTPKGQEPEPDHAKPDLA